MENLFYSLISGILLGLSAGISPGPLFAMVISQTLRYSTKEGIKIAFAPVFTDIPVIIASVLILLRFSNSNAIIGTISIFGFLLLSYYAYKSISIKSVDFKANAAAENSFVKGVLTNFFNPHLYIYHVSVTTPLIISSLSTSIIPPIFFLAGFLVSLVTSKIVLAIFVGKSKKFISSKYYIYSIKILGVFLFLFGLKILKDGLELLGLV